MTEGKPYLPWPGGDDKIVVAEMLRDSLSGQWYECCEFIKWLVRVQATNISRDHWDDIVQEAMIRVNKYLPTFQFHCKLRTWLFSIVRSCIIDFYRKFIRVEEALDPIDDTQDVVEGEGGGGKSHVQRTRNMHNFQAHLNESIATTGERNISIANIPGAVEDECIKLDEISQGLAALEEYVSTHGNPERNARILDMVIFEGRSLEAAAKAVGCSAPVAGYVVRSAQRYAREKVRQQH